MSAPAAKLSVYFGERTRAGERLLADELLDLCARHSIRLSVLMRGIQGFGAKHRLRSDRLLTLSEDLPLVALAMDTPERIAELAGELADLDAAGLATMERLRFVEGADPVPVARNYPHAAERAAAPPSPPSQLKLTVCVGRHERVDGQPAFVAACETLHRAGVDGATVLLGVDGTVGGERRRAGFFARNLGVPLLVMSVGAAEPIEHALAALAQQLPSAPLTVERAHVFKRDGRLLRALPADEDPTGGQQAPLNARAKLTVVISEAARHDGRPIYLQLVRRLRERGAEGATSLRGIWGFHGDHPPHGDRLLSLRRHVPVVTELIDTPQRIAELFPIVDELTSERGLVTSELVPASVALPGDLAL